MSALFPTSILLTLSDACCSMFRIQFRMSAKSVKQDLQESEKKARHTDESSFANQCRFLTVLHFMADAWHYPCPYGGLDFLKNVVDKSPKKENEYRKRKMVKGSRTYCWKMIHLWHHTPVKYPWLRDSKLAYNTILEDGTSKGKNNYMQVS